MKLGPITLEMSQVHPKVASTYFGPPIQLKPLEIMNMILHDVPSSEKPLPMGKRSPSILKGFPTLISSSIIFLPQGIVNLEVHELVLLLVSWYKLL